MIAISISGISGSVGVRGEDRGESDFTGLGDVQGIVMGAIGAKFAPPGVRAFVEEAIEHSIASDREAALAQTLSLSEDFGQTLFEEFGSILDAFLEITEEPPSREAGFVCVHPGNETWLPRGLYEGRQRIEWQEARRPQRRPWSGRRPECLGGRDSIGRRSFGRRR